MQAIVDVKSTNSPPTSEPRPRYGLGSQLRDPIWPLAVLFVGFPLWWILGLSSFVALMLALPMAVQLWRKRQVVVPGGFGWWLIFLVWVAIGVFVLFADAPGAVSGGGVSRLAVFAYRFSWYLTATIVLLWLANTSRRTIPFTRVANLVGWLFVFCVVGGLLGVLVPTLDFKSVFEILLPKSISGNSFVRSLIHPQLADIQNVLGRPEARPKAPFGFANTWGSCLSLTLPFFLVGWLRHGRRWQQLVSFPVLVVATIPIVYSLNRGLWASLLAGVVFFVVLQASRGKMIALFVSTSVVAACLLVLATSPLGSLIGDRIEHQHSNDRRGQLLTQTVRSAATGSPVIGFGSTRDVQGSFASIAGGSTPDCKACGVPPLGTQGQLWLVIFSQGLVGTIFFLGFFLTSFFRSWRCRSTPEVVATCVLIFFGIQIFVYDTPELPLYVVMMAIALAWREQSRAAGSDNYLIRVRTLRTYYDAIWPNRLLLIISVVVGMAAGLGIAASLPQTYAAREKIILAPSPSHLVTGIAVNRSPKEITVDTEAALAVSVNTLRRVSDSRVEANELRKRIAVTAEPNTSVLVLEVRDTSPARAERQVSEVGSAYLEARQEYLLQRRSQVLADLRERYAQLSTLGLSTQGNQITGSAARGAVAAEMESVDTAINEIVLTPTSAGSVLRNEPLVKVDKEFALFGASGAALGLIVALGVIGYRASRSRVRTVARLGLTHVGTAPPDAELVSAELVGARQPLPRSGA